MIAFIGCFKQVFHMPGDTDGQVLGVAHTATRQIEFTMQHPGGLLAPQETYPFIGLALGFGQGLGKGWA